MLNIGYALSINSDRRCTAPTRLGNSMKTQICTLLLADLIAVMSLTWLFKLPAAEQREPVPECYATLLGATGSRLCPTTIQTFSTFQAAVYATILVGTYLTITHTRVFLDYQALCRPLKAAPLGYDLIRTGMTVTMAMTLTCDACGTTAHSDDTRENDRCRFEYETPTGWTHAHGEVYCPICADVRAQTWGDHLQTEESKG